MAHSVLYIPSAFSFQSDKDREKPLLSYTRADFKWPLMFMLSMALLGLNFYPAILLIAVILVNRYRHDPYDLLIMLFMLCGGYGLTRTKILSVPIFDIGLLIGVTCIILIRKPPIIKKTLAVWVLYFIGLVVIASYSWESMSIQLRVMRYYLSFIVFAVPLVVFANKPFNADTFFRRLMIYVLLMCAFYIIDGAILRGDIFVPSNTNWFKIESVFYKPYMEPFRLQLFRKYPTGMYIIALAILPICRYYKLRWWMWLLIIGACMITQTFTLILGVLTACILFQGSVKRLFITVGCAIAAFGILYVVDSLLPRDAKTDKVSSALRIQSSIDQVIDLFDAVDDEDLAEFASGRLAQVIPKVDLIDFYNKEATGLGFVHPELSKSSKFVITNDYYSDVSNSIEVATEVEIVPVQVYIHSGWAGVVLHLLFFVFLYYIIRKLKYREIFAAAVYTCFMFGLGGFCSLASYQGLNIAATAYAVVILANRCTLEGFSQSDTPRKDEN